MPPERRADGAMLAVVCVLLVAVGCLIGALLW
jgi:hypothetical protein